LGLPNNLIKAFPNNISIIKFDYVFKGISHPFWVSNFTSNGGSFNLKIDSSAAILIGVRIQLKFGLGLHIKK
jgi:hypothetical protein